MDSTTYRRIGWTFWKSCQDGRWQGTLHDAVVDQAKLKDEWIMVKEITSTNNYRECSSQDAWTIMLQNETLFPNVSKLVKIALLIPINTADCERGFSRPDQDKSEGNNESQFDSQLIYGNFSEWPTLRDLSSLNFCRAFEV